MRSNLDNKRFRLMLVVSPNAAGERDLVVIFVFFAMCSVSVQVPRLCV
jgi:hypothetical protein